MAQIATDLEAALAELCEPATREAVAFALGQRAGETRVAEILRHPLAREFPDDALRLAMQTELPATEAVDFLRRLRPSGRCASANVGGRP